jgi:aminoglycoside 2''-phosphotransferase
MIVMDHMIEHYLPRMQTIRPDLAIKSIRLNTEGLVNDVLIVNEQIVFRFAKNEAAERALGSELAVLEAVRPAVSLKLPQPAHIEQDMIVYPLLPGVAFSRDRMAGLAGAERQAAANRLGDFLHSLHNLRSTADLPHSSAPVTREAWQVIRQQVEERVYPHLMAHQREWAEGLFNFALTDPEFFEYRPGLIHGDLGPYHILFDPQRRRIDGIIDFGVAGLGDPANDIGLLLQIYGEAFVRQMEAAYPGLAAWMRRARFYAQAIEMQWAALAVETQEPTWFLAHLGGAREIQLGR